jgi:hypothetical protein
MENLEYVSEEVIKAAFEKLGGIVRPDLNGQILFNEVLGHTYFIDEGFRRRIPNTDTYIKLFAQNKALKYPDTELILSGADISVNAVLVKGSRSVKHYFIENFQKRWITSEIAMSKYSFNKAGLATYEQSIVDQIPEGKPFD